MVILSNSTPSVANFWKKELTLHLPDIRITNLFTYLFKVSSKNLHIYAIEIMSEI